MEKLLTVAQVAEILNVKESTLYKWTHNRKIHFVKLSGRILRFRQSDLERWIESKQSAPATPTPPRPRPGRRAGHTKFTNDYVDRLVENAKKEVLGERYQKR